MKLNFFHILCKDQRQPELTNLIKAINCLLNKKLERESFLFIRNKIKIQAYKNIDLIIIICTIFSQELLKVMLIKN